MTTNSANTANTAIAKEAVETNGAQSQQTDPPTLQLDNVSYAYTKGGKRVLKNISHDFQAGKVHAITGPSGAGKTTLLSLISGLATPTEGMVLVDGADLSERDRYRFRSHDIGVIFQNFNLLPNLTVAENIILSMDTSGKTFDKSKRTIVEELLEQVSADDLAEFGLLPEFIGRLPVVSVLDELTEADLARILTEPKNALVKQYRKMFAVDGVDLAFTEQAVNAIASTAITRGTGARGLRSIIEKTLEETMFELPGMDDVQQVIVDAASVRGEGLPKLVRGERRLVA